MTPAQHRRARELDVHRIASLRAKLFSTVDNLLTAEAADNNSAVGNLLHDIETLAHEIGGVASRAFLSADAIRVAEWEAAQRQAEIDHGPLIADLRAIIADAANVTVLRPANHDHQPIGAA